MTPFKSCGKFLNMSDRSFPFPRVSGVLLHPTSLPSPWGIGDLGPEAYSFVDFLEEAGQGMWQVCPLGPTGYGDSPYQCFSSRAGNANLISIDDLIERRLLNEVDATALRVESRDVDFSLINREKPKVLQAAYKRFFQPWEDTSAYREFVESQKDWLNPFVEFMVAKEIHGGAPWFSWDTALRYAKPEALDFLRREYSDRLDYFRFLQFLFFDQWSRLKGYANEKSIQIIGDLPIYLSHDSVEAWRTPELFQFDDELKPVVVAGVPPDYFSATGQLWGNPIYNWDYFASQRFAWWIDTLSYQLSFFDLLRIDHFRGFSAYWAVPYGEKTAASGTWVPAPGKELFDEVFRQLGPVPVIAENLGVITEDVSKLMELAGLPGMKILQFAFDSAEENDYLPHSYTPFSVVYTGTHDNDTIRGWFESAGKKDRDWALTYLNSDGREIHWDFIRAALASVSTLAVIPVQDVLGLGTEARMNVPGTLGGNWKWRLKWGELTGRHAKRLRSMTELYGRIRRRTV